MAGIGTGNLDTFNTLVFDSLEFLFRYLPLFLLLFFIVPQKGRPLLLFLGSFLFYAMGEPRYFFVLLGMSAVNYLFGKSLGMGAGETRQEGSSEEKLGRRKGLLCIAVSCNLLLLFYFKISNALDRSFLLPLGISFYTFKSISYLADVYRRTTEAETSFIRFGAYLCMFPQIVSGPIMRYQTARKGLHCGKISLRQVEDGLKWLVFGLAAKVLLADRLGILWNDIQTIGFESISTPLAWLGAAAYSLRLYFDFAGYSMMAAGMGRMLGFPFLRNFNYPYASRSVSEFYRRWHMTLGNWFRDYVYIPLGGNKKGPWKRALFTTITFSLSGLWHGAGWNFVIWGLLHSTYMNIENALRTCLAARKKAGGGYIHNCCSLGKRILSWAITFALCSFAWIFFRAETMADAGYIIRHCLDGIGSPVQYCLNAYRDIGPGMYAFFVTVFALMLLLTYDIVNEKKDTIQAVSELPVYLRWPIYISFMLVLLLLMYQESTAPFIYFQF